MSLDHKFSQGDVLTLGHGLGIADHELKKILNQYFSHPLVTCVDQSYVDIYVHQSIDTMMF